MAPEREPKVLTIDDRIRSEFNRLRRIFRELPKDRKDIAVSLIRNAAFMAVTLEDLQVKINKEGPVAEYQNGENQWGTKKSPEVDIYNVMIKNHAQVIRQLCDLLPGSDGKDKDKEKADALAAFLAKGKGKA